MSVASCKLRRYWDCRTCPISCGARRRAPCSPLGCCGGLRPQLVFATGGFVALPVALAARLCGIPVVVHEQTSVLGLANRIAGRFAQRIALTFPIAGEHVPADRVTVTGVRRGPARRLGRGACRVSARSRRADRLRHRRRAGRPHDRSRPWTPPPRAAGARAGHPPVGRQRRHGRSRVARGAARLRAAGSTSARGMRWCRTSAPSSAHVYAAADPARPPGAGAGTVNECCHLGLVAVYVPLPGGERRRANGQCADGRGRGRRRRHPRRPR